MLIALAATFLIGLAGLSVDLVMVYAVKTYLSTAADSAAMGGIRALERGVSYADQEAEIQRVTDMLFDANFPDGLLLTGNTGQLAQQVKVAGATMDPMAPSTFELDPNLSPGMREVRVITEAEAPTFFMRMFGWDTIQVKASAYAARRDVNVMVVLDRSASLASVGAWDDVQRAAITFVEQFDNNRDRVGVVTFGTGGNIDVPLATGFKTGDLAKNAILAQTVPASAYTNAPYGLWLAYSELLRVNDASALNAIVYFTDGQPSAFPGFFPTRLAPVSSGSPFCNLDEIQSVIGAYQDTSIWNSPRFYDISGLWKKDAGPAPVRGGATDYDHEVVDDCNNMNDWATNAELALNSAIPWPARYWVANPSGGLKSFCIQPGASLCEGDAGNFTYSRTDSRLYQTGGTTADQTFKGTNIHNASKNLLLNIAQAARQDMALGGVNIHAIGLGGHGYDADTALMKSMVNDPSDSYGVTVTTYQNEPMGSYTYAPSIGELKDAFSKVRSEVMRLTK